MGSLVFLAVLVVVVVVAVALLKGFDRIAGRGPKQVSDGIRDSGITDSLQPHSPASVAGELEKLATLRTSGILTEEESQAQKKKLLS